jgi:transposase
MSEMQPESLDTIWRAPDALWERMSKVLAVYDPPAKTGRPRINQRLAMDALIYRLRTGCQWNYLPAEFGWGMSVWRTLRRWEEKGILDILWALLLVECEELGGVDWCWQAADGCLGKARGIPRTEKGALAMPMPVSARTRRIAPKQASRRACLSRAEAAPLLPASPGPTSPM